MDAILGNYLSHGDTIIVHMCGVSKDLHLTKTQEYLGLTITDNGQGRAFVKKVKSSQPIVEDSIRPGDHIAAINAESTVGLRHYEVAKAIREVPQNTNFTIRLIEPKYSDKFLKQDQLHNDDYLLEEQCGKNRLTSIAPLTSVDNFDNSPNWAISPNNNDLFCDDLIHSSLPIERLLSKRAPSADNGQIPAYSFQTELKLDNPRNNRGDTYRVTIDKINSLLDSFLGINDNLLAIQIYRLARENKDSYNQFLDAIHTSELNAFDFDDEMKRRLWNCATKHP